MVLVTAIVRASGGDGGHGAAPGIGGDGIATLAVSGGTLDVFAEAIAGQGVIRSGIATAAAPIDGADGTAAVSARAGLAGSAVSVIGRASLSVDGAATLVARAQAGGADPLTLDRSADAFALVHADIADDDMATILAGNDAVRSAFGDDVEIACTGLFGGAKAGGEGVQTITNTTTIAINVADLEGSGDGVFGFVDGDVLGAGFDSLRLEISNSQTGETLFSRTFADEADANAFFDDSAINLGDLRDYVGGFGDVSLDISLVTTASEKGGGYAAEFIFGDIGDHGEDDDPVSGSSFTDTTAIAQAGPTTAPYIYTASPVTADIIVI